MYRLHQCQRMVGIHIGMDPMAKVKDVPGTITVTRKHLAHGCTDLFWRGVENTGIDVSLQRNPVAHKLACVGQIGGPVNAKGIASALRHRLQPLASAFGKQDNGHPAPLILPGQFLDDALHVGQ